MTAAAAGRHRSGRPAPWYRRILGRLRAARQRRQVEAAKDDAYVVRIEAHAPPPLAVAQARLAGLYAVLHPDQAPPAAVLPDEPDERWPHLAPVYKDDTLTFGLSITEAGQ